VTRPESDNSRSIDPGGDPTREQILVSLERVLASSEFSESAQLSRFLRYIVESRLADETNPLKESAIGVEVFRRGPNYDPKSDPIVRVEARRVRSRLQAYYRSDGFSDEVVLQYPCGSYVPQVLFRTPGVQKQAPVIAVLPFVPHRPHSNERFAESLTREVIRELNRCRTVRVFSGSLERTQQNRVEGLLTGRVATIAHRVRVTAQLISTRNTQELWSAAFEAEPVNARTAQKQIAFATAHALSTHLSSQASSQEGHHPDTHPDGVADARNEGLPAMIAIYDEFPASENHHLHDIREGCCGTR